MNKYPEFAQIGDTKYKINTDFRVALRCNDIAMANVLDEERSLAIVYLLFGDKGLNDTHNWNSLLEIALKYLRCGKESSTKGHKTNERVDIDFNQDWNYIQTSFFYDYHIDLQVENMHWWKFYNLLCGLSDKCVLNRVRFVREFDINQIKDAKEREKWIRQKELVALRIEKTEQEKKLDELFDKQLKGE